jgi:hypothetical protein
MFDLLTAVRSDSERALSEGERMVGEASQFPEQSSTGGDERRPPQRETRQDQMVREGRRFFSDPPDSVSRPARPHFDTSPPAWHHMRFGEGERYALAALIAIGAYLPVGQVVQIALMFALLGIIVWLAVSAPTRIRTAKPLARVAFGLLVLSLIGAPVTRYLLPRIMHQHEEANAAQVTPSPRPSIPRAPIQTYVPATIGWASLDGPPPQIFADVRIANSTLGVIHVSTYGKALVRPVARTDAEKVRILDVLKDEVRRLVAAGGAAVVAVPPQSDQMHFTIPGPGISKTQWTDFQEGKLSLYFYALINEKLDDGTRTSLPECGIAHGVQVDYCPERTDLGQP